MRAFSPDSDASRFLVDHASACLTQTDSKTVAPDDDVLVDGTPVDIVDGTPVDIEVCVCVCVCVQAPSLDQRKTTFRIPVNSHMHIRLRLKRRHRLTSMPTRRCSKSFKQLSSE